jgi:hypothetical protein
MPGYRAWGFSALLICSACSGDDFTSGSGNTGGQSAGGQTSGGNGGSGGATGGSGGTGTGGVAGSLVSGGSGGEAGVPPPKGGAAGVAGVAGSGGPTPCDYANNGCPVGEYCDAVNCGAGTCKPKQADQDGTYSPVCGCNGITYWNTSVAAHAGEPIKADGACTIGNAQKCPNGICPGISKCGKSVLNQTACGGAVLLASCWTLPPTCADSAEPKAFGCENGCLSKCELITLQDQYYNEGCN